MQMHDKRWPMFNRVLEQARRMDQIMDCLGVDAAVAAREQHGEMLARARAVCLACPFAEACKAWLACRDPGQTEPPRFCPNAGFFAAIRSRGARPPRRS